ERPLLAGEIQDLREVVGVRVAYGEGRETPAPLDHLEDGRVVIDARGDRGAPGEGGDDEAGDAEPPLLEARIHVRRRAGRDVLEEPAPLVEVDDEDGVLPRRARRHRLVRAVQERLAGADVAVRVVVPRGPL